MAQDPQPPRVRWTFHGTIATPSYQNTFAWLERIIGAVALEFGDAGPPISRLGGCCWIAGAQLEVAEPNSAGSPTAKFLRRFGAGYLNLALQVDDLAVADRWFAAHGLKTSPTPDNHFTFTRSRDTCGLQFEWSDFSDLKWDPRLAGFIPPRHAGLIEVARIAYWGALVDDPAAAVEKFKELWRADVLFEDFDAPLSCPAAAIGLGDGVLSLYRRPTDIDDEWRLWGSRTGLPHFHRMALRVDDLSAAEDTLVRDGVRLSRGSAASGEIFTEREDTSGIAMAWTDRDVAGDPRGDL